MPDGFLRALLDPTAPLPLGWPSGALGAFLLFLVPIGGGIPVGVLMARDGGVSPPITALMYFVSDVVQAFTAEPLLLLLLLLGRWLPAVARLGQRLASLTQRSGMRDGKLGPLGLILLSFTVDPLAGRAAAATAGHGFVPGWSLAITGDMLYFAVLMTSTLWLSSVLGDERLTVGAVLLITFLGPTLVRHWRQRARGLNRPPAPEPALVNLESTRSGRPERRRRGRHGRRR